MADDFPRGGFAEDDEATIDAAWLAEQFRVHRGARRAHLARLLDIDAPAVTKMVQGKRKIQLAEAGIIRRYFADLAARDEMRGDLAPVRVLPFRAGQLPPIEVRGTAAGSFAGAFRIEREPVDAIFRPPALEHAREVYALRIVGTSMEPEHRPGDIRLIDPNRHPRAGDSVVVRARYAAKQPVQAFLGHLVLMNDREVTIAKLNPAAKVKFDARFVESVHRVMTTNEMFGR